MPHRTRIARRSERRILFAAAIGALGIGACVIYVPDPDGGGGGGGGGGNTVTLHAQMLVMINLDPGVVNMAPYYSDLIAGYQTALSKQTPRIWIDQFAIAPINQTTAGGARFIYSENDPDPMGSGTAADGGVEITLDPTGSVDAGDDVDGGGSSGSIIANSNGTLLSQMLEAALSFEYLPADPTRGEQQNLADLGSTITTQSVYQSAGTNPDGLPAFTAPEDLFIVLTMAHLARDCGPTDTNCLLQGQTPMAYFAASDISGHAAWLNFGAGTGVPVNHVFHLPVFTAEAISSASFVSQCSNRPGFPQAFVDLIEPSPTAYYGPFAAQFNPSSNVINEDFCVMLSAQAAPRVISDASKVAQVMSGG